VRGGESGSATKTPQRRGLPHPAAGQAGAQAAGSQVAAKPRLRGWIHATAAPIALVAGAVLVARAPTASASAAAFVCQYVAVSLVVYRAA